MKILILTPGFPTQAASDKGYNGSEFLLAEASAYRQAGAQVTVLTPHAPGLPLREQLDDGVEVVRFRYFFPPRWQAIRDAGPIYSNSNMLIKFIQLPFFITAFFYSTGLHMLRNDIVHANWTPTALFALLFQRLFKTPVVLTYRGSDLRLLPRWLNRFITRQVSAVLDVWGETGWAKEQRNLFPGRYIKLPSISYSGNFDADIPSPSSNSEVHIAFISRLVTEGVDRMKGTTAVIPATKIAVNSFDRLIVDIVGDGTYRCVMEQNILELGLSSHVIMHGFQPDVFAYLSRSIAAIVSTGLSGSLREAALCKRLLIIPDIPEQNGDLWIHKENALLYKPCDPQSLAEAIIFAASYPAEAETIALKGHETVIKFVTSVEKGGPQYTSAFHKIIQELNQT